MVAVPLRVLIVQHGEKQRLPGDPGLTPLGQEQARITADWLGRSETPLAVWSSPMRRAVETAAAVREKFALECVIDPRLRERMNWAGADGESIEDFLEDWQRASSDRTYTPQSGDSSAESATRFLDALGDLAGVYRTGTVIVVAHGGVTTDALRTLLGDDQLVTRSPEVWDVGIPCCAITTLQFDGERWSVESIAVTSHLVQGSAHRHA